MGSTLEHGIYLPSEGEKNCYQGLAGNWNKVDGALGDIAELRQLIENKFTKEIVTELPTEDINPYCIYMILKTVPETDNIYDEWVYINNSWEYLGNTKVDMTQYYTKQEVNQLPAVASGVTATKVGNYDAHIANGDIHVTASDKTKWTNSANTHVLRLALSALTPSTSDNSFSNLDDSTALKVGDKVMDTAGVLFSVTAIDTANSTFTIGTPLTQLAVDSGVVHKSGDETVIGSKRFGVVQSFTGYPSIRLYSIDDDINVLPSSAQQRDIRFTDKNNALIAYFIFQHRNDANEPFRTCWRQQKMDGTDGYYSINFNNLGIFYPENNNAIDLGGQGNRWKSVYATNYYYGSNNVEFSTKFVTTDTDQTISARKIFNVTPFIYNPDSTASTPNLFLKSSKAIKGDTSGSNSDAIRIAYTDKNDKLVNYIQFRKSSNGSSDITLYCATVGSNNQDISSALTFFKAIDGNGVLRPAADNDVSLGNNSYKFKDVQTYKVNNLEPSSLSLPSGNASDVIDISSYLVNLDGTANTYTAPVNGWISIAVIGTAIAIVSSRWSDSRLRETSGNVRMLYPVLKNETVSISVIGTTLDYARFIPCQGNV